MKPSVKWTAEEDATLRRMMAGGSTYMQAAGALGRSRCSVAGRCERLKIKSLNNPAAKSTRTAPRMHGACRVWTPEEVTRLRELRASGMIVVDIAVALGRSFDATKKKLKDEGIRIDEPKRAERTARPFVRQVVERPETVVSIFDLRASSCRFSFGEVGADDFGFCGKPVAKPGDSWCPSCRRVVYVPKSHGRRRVA